MRKIKRILSFALSMAMIISAFAMCTTVSTAEAASRGVTPTPTFKIWKFDEAFSIGAAGSAATVKSGPFALDAYGDALNTTVTTVNGVASITRQSDGKRAFSKSASGIIDITPASQTCSQVYFTAPEAGFYIFDVELQKTSMSALPSSAYVNNWTEVGPRTSLSSTYSAFGVVNGMNYSAAAIGNNGVFTATDLTFTGEVSLTAGQVIVISINAGDDNNTDETQTTLKKFDVYKIDTSGADTFTYNESAPAKVNGNYTLAGTIPGTSTLDYLEASARDPWWNSSGNYLTWHLAADYYWDGNQTYKYPFFSKSQYGGLIDAIPLQYAPSVILYTAPYTGTYCFSGEFKKGTDCTSTVSVANVGSVTSDVTGKIIKLDGMVELTEGEQLWVKISTDSNSPSTEVAVNSIKMTYIGDLPNVTIREFDVGDASRIWLVQNEVGKLPSGKTYTLNGENMLWSNKYGAYSFLIISDTEPTLDSLNLSMVNGNTETVTGSMDINGNGAIEINDAQFVYNMYNGDAVTDFSGITMKQLLSADIVGGNDGKADYAIDISDAMAIMDACYGNSQQMVSMWTEHSYDRTEVGTSVPLDAQGGYMVYMAKNEDEGVNVTLFSETDMDSLSVKVISGDNKYITSKLYFARPVTVTDKEYSYDSNGNLASATPTSDPKDYVDALIPLESYGEISLDAGLTSTVFVDFKTSVNTPAGDYPYEIALVDEFGVVLSSVRVTVHVWNFALYYDAEGNQTAPRFGTTASIYTYGFTSSVDRYEMLLDYGLSAYRLPYDILDDRADAYMSDIRVTSFIVPVEYDHINKQMYDEKQIKAYCRKLATNPEWLAKAYFYPLDEPHTVDGYYSTDRYGNQKYIPGLNDLKNACEHLKAILAAVSAEVGYEVDIRITSPYYTNLWYSYETSGMLWNPTVTGVDQIEFMDQYISMHTPKLANWNDTYLNSQSGYGSKKTPQQIYGKTFAQRMQEIQNNGEEVWAYVCNEPNTEGYLNLTIDDEGLGHRVVFWQFYQRDITGFTYWSVNCWVAEDRWNDLDYHRGNWHGDGILTYPGEDYGLYGQLLPSLRLVSVRDGLEDIELLYMAEEVFKNDESRLLWIEGQVDGVSTSLTSICNSEDFNSLRITMGNLIEAALNNQQ